MRESGVFCCNKLRRQRRPRNELLPGSKEVGLFSLTPADPAALPEVPPPSTRGRCHHTQPTGRKSSDRGCCRRMFSSRTLPPEPEKYVQAGRPVESALYRSRWRRWRWGLAARACPLAGQRRCRVRTRKLHRKCRCLGLRRRFETPSGAIIFLKVELSRMAVGGFCVAIPLGRCGRRRTQNIGESLPRLATDSRRLGGLTVSCAAT